MPYFYPVSTFKWVVFIIFFYFSLIIDNFEIMSCDFESFDKFGRKSFADRLTKVITRFYPFYDEAFVLSLNAKYGSGKTTFLDMWENDLTSGDDPYQVIRINAWETDFDEDPIVSIVAALLSALEGNSPVVDALKNGLRKTLVATGLVANSVFSKVTGIDPLQITEKLSDLTADQTAVAVGNAIYEGYSFKKDAYELLRETLAAYVETLECKPLVIFVDELDRVRPSYAVEFLEAIKHLFSVQGVCFVIAVDKVQLEKSIRQLYGDIDFQGYYERFITREANLPEVKYRDIRSYVEVLFDDFFDRKEAADLTVLFVNDDRKGIVKFLSNLMRVFGFTPRNIKTFFRIFSQFLVVDCSDEKRHINDVLGIAFLVAVSVKDEHVYYKIGRDLISSSDLVSFVRELDYSILNAENSFLDSLLQVVTAFALCERNSIEKKEDELAVEVLGRVSSFEVLDSDQSSYNKYNKLEDNCQNFVGRHGEPILSNSRFSEIYTSLESWSDFIDGNK